jgi:hypothetical protein
MGSMTAQGTLPAAGSGLNAAPVTDTFNHVMTTYNGKNITEPNCDTTSSNGMVGLSVTQTITGPKTLTGALVVNAAMTFNEAGADVDFRSESADNAYMMFQDGAKNALVFGSNTDVSSTDTPFLIEHHTRTASTTVSFDRFKVGGANAVTIPSGTTARATGAHFAEPNFTATGTITSAATVYIAAAPTEGGTNYALWVDAGLARFDGVLSVNDTTESTSGTTGSIHTDGGLGVAKDIYVGDDILMASGGVINFASSNSTITHSSGLLTHNVAWTNTGLITATAGLTTGSNIVSDADSTDDLGTASVRWANVYTDSIGDTSQDLTVAATTVNLPDGHIFDYNGADVTVTHSTNTLTVAGGVLAVTDATEATSTTAASLKTAGGIAWVKDAYVGDDMYFTSAAILDFASDVTITHSSNTLTVAGGTWATAALTASTITGSGVLRINDATESTSTTTGSLQTDGGIAWVKDAYVGDDMYFTSAAVLDFASSNLTLTHSSGLLTNSGAWTNTGLVTATAGLTTGSNIVSDTDSTDDLGTASVRWANVYTDSIGDSGQDLTVAATTVNLPSGHIFDYNGADVTLTHAANKLTFAGGDFHVADGVVVGHTAQLTTHPLVIPELQVIGTNGLLDAAIGIVSFQATAVGPRLTLSHSNHGTIGTHVVLDADDQVGSIDFASSDGSVFQQSAYIRVFADAAQGAGDLPTRMVFSTTSDGAASVAERMRIDNAGIIFTGAETANANMSGGGITLNQNAADNEILAFKSTGDVCHNIIGITEADTYGSIGKVGATGGLMIRGFTELAAQALRFEGTLNQAADTSDTTGSGAAVYFVLYDTDGGSGRDAPAATGNIFGIATPTATRVLFKSDGTVHASDTSWATALDDLPDAVAGRALVTRRAEENGGGVLAGYKIHAPQLVDMLEERGIVTAAEGPENGNEGHRFLNLQKGIKFSWDMGFQNFLFLAEVVKKIMTPEQIEELPAEFKAGLNLLEA